VGVVDAAPGEKRKPSMKKRAILFIEIALLIFLGLICISAAISFSYRHNKTLWDWLDLLIVPAVLALGAWWLNLVSKKNEQERAERENRVEREIASDRMQDAMLQTYFDRMTELLLEKNLRTSQEDDEVRTVARIRTLTTLGSLDGVRKGVVVRFLYEAGLISVKKPSETSEVVTSIIDLREADLREVDLAGADLNGVNLSMARLKGANLSATKLNGAELRNTSLTEADLSYAELNNARLCSSLLIGTKLNYSQMNKADLSGAFLIGADLSSVSLMGANLHKAHLDRVNLREAILIRADLNKTDLSGADLSETEITPKQLSQVASLKGAIMPDGTRHD
jgi:uncharacterized protein YjbI with pentapeptide repeats